MLRSPFTKWLWDGRRSLTWWTVAIVGVGSCYAAFWPTVDSQAMRDALDSYPEGLLEALNYDISNAAGYLTSTVYGLLAAVLVLVHVVGAGGRVVAGDEEAGTLDLVLAHPVGRATVALHRFAAVVTGVVVISVALLLAMLVLARPIGLDGISVSGFVAMHLHLVLFAVFFAAVAYSVGAATGRRSYAVSAGAAVGVFGYAASGIIPQVDGLEWVRTLSPFHWLVAGSPLENGVQPEALAMLAPAGVLVAAGTAAFSRRDIAV